MSDLNSYILQKDHIIYTGGAKPQKKLIGLNLPGTGEASVMDIGMMPPSKSRERHSGQNTAAFANQLIQNLNRINFQQNFHKGNHR